MKRWALPILVFGIGVALGGWLTLDRLPGLIMNRAMERIAGMGTETGAARHAPRLTEANQTIVRASPDILYSICVYDVSASPMLINVPWPADGNYASVSFYDAKTNNFAVINDRDEVEADTTRILLQANNSGELTPLTLPAYEAGQDRLILAPPSGLVLYRRVIDAETDIEAADAERRNFTCAQLSDQ